ncbi:hypothetical protein Sjap_004374 [Stephania japonica]|uniref:3-hydroxyisobutyryl-CoA hydrolase n=1 Tax=Stephania japonica TaxID=461633 RepID=A0AAP0K2F6_9MAGN
MLNRVFPGEYLGLTGARINGAEMLACGLATHFVPSTCLASLERELCKTNSVNPAVTSAILDVFAEQWQPSKLELVTDEIVDLFFTIIEEEDWAELQLPSKSSPAAKLAQPNSEISLLGYFIHYYLVVLNFSMLAKKRRCSK